MSRCLYEEKEDIDPRQAQLVWKPTCRDTNKKKIICFRRFPSNKDKDYSQFKTERDGERIAVQWVRIIPNIAKRSTARKVGKRKLMKSQIYMEIQYDKIDTWLEPKPC